MAETYFEKGKCDACGFIYNNSIYADGEFSRDHPKDEVYTCKCPKCGYHPRVLRSFKELLEADGNIIIKEGKIMIDGGLAEKILKDIIEKWPEIKKFG